MRRKTKSYTLEAGNVDLKTGDPRGIQGKKSGGRGAQMFAPKKW